jgi:hypothetical protein
MEQLNGILFTAIVILGPILLGIAIYFGMQHTRSRHVGYSRQTGPVVTSEDGPATIGRDTRSTKRALLGLGTPVVVALAFIVLLFATHM